MGPKYLYQFDNSMTPDENFPTMNFFDRLGGPHRAATDSVVSVGLDADTDRIPEHLHEYDLPRWAFNRRIIDATHEHAAVYKPNAAFYEDADGWARSAETIAYAHGKDVPVLLDAKRADIGNTARQYAKLLDSTPTPSRSTRTWVVTRSTRSSHRRRRASSSSVGPRIRAGQTSRTSNSRPARRSTNGSPRSPTCWNGNGNVGLVVGATTPDELENSASSVPDLPFLVPGVGAQGGDVEAAVEYGLADGVGTRELLAGNHLRGRGAGERFAEAAGQAAKRLKKRLNQYR